MRNLLRGYKIEARLFVVLAVICIMLSLTAPQFATLPNITSLLNNNSINLIWAVGLLVVLIAGGIDISFAVASSVVQYIAVKLLMPMGGGNWVLGFLFCGTLGILLGLLNAWLIHGFRIISIVVTIATFNAFFGLLMFFSGGRNIYNLPEWWTARIFIFEHQNADGIWSELNLSVVVMVERALWTRPRCPRCGCSGRRAPWRWQGHGIWLYSGCLVCGDYAERMEPAWCVAFCLPDDHRRGDPDRDLHIQH